MTTLENGVRDADLLAGGIVMKPYIMASFDGDPVHEAMALVEDCKGYLKAVELAPSVVLDESPPHQFLSFCQGNVKEAAERLAMYWKTRIFVFGERDAFQPMTQVVTAHDVDLLEVDEESTISGPDQHGRMIVFIDETNCSFEDEYSKDELFRTYFFYLHGVQRACWRANCTDVVFVITWSYNMHWQLNKEQNTVKFLRQLVGKALCYRIVQFNIVASLEPGLYKTFLSTMLPSIVQRITERLVSVPIVAHVGTQEEILDSLQEHGVGGCYLPTSIGGSWTSNDGDNVVAWLKSSHLAVGKQPESPQEEKTAQGETLDPDMMSFCADLMEMPMEHWENMFADDQGFKLEEAEDIEKSLGGVLLPEPNPIEQPPISLDPEPSLSADQKGCIDVPHRVERREARDPALDWHGQYTEGDAKTEESKSQVGWLNRQTSCTSSSSNGSMGNRFGTLRSDWLQLAMKKVKDNAAYYQAMKRDPDVVYAESPPAQFLSFCSGDAVAAASRLAVYWSMRVKVFGAENAFLPIAQAVSADELVRAQAGTSVILPHADSEGRPTLFIDHSRARYEDFGQAVVVREIFFMLQCISKMCHESQREELIAMFRWTPYAHSLVQRETLPFLATLVHDGMCLRPTHFHIVGVFPGGADKVFWSTQVPVFVSRFHEDHEDTTCSTIVHAGTELEVLNSLREHDMVPDGLPTTLGGRWTYENDLPKWLQSQLGARPLPPKPKPPPAEAPSSASVQNASLNELMELGMQSSGFFQGRHVKRAMPGTNANKKPGQRKTVRRSRQQNVIYSRRKRAKQKMREEELKSSTASLQCENKELRLEEARLQHLLAQARLLAAKEDSARSEGAAAGVEEKVGEAEEPVVEPSVMLRAMEPPLAQCLESLRQRQEALTNEIYVRTSASLLGGRRSSDDTRSVRSSAASVLSASLAGSGRELPTERNSIAGLAPTSLQPDTALQPSTFLQLLRQRIHELDGK